VQAGERQDTPEADGAPLRSLHERLAAHGQAHVLRFWDQLDPAGRQRLERQLAGIDLAALGAVRDALQRPPSSAGRRLAPPPVIRRAELEADPARRRRASEHGAEMLAAGRVAALVVAGGQASRLGWPGPKGAFPIGPVTGRTLLGLQAQRIRGLRRRYGARLPWLVMTSDATHAGLRHLFETEDWFGLEPDEVTLFRQASVPSVDFEGKLLLERPDRVFENPDGHGGALPALAACGGLDGLEARGVRTLFTYQVDNPLVRIAEPLYLGLHAAAGAEASCKVVAKRAPEEKVGHVVSVDGHIEIVEYTEIDAAWRDARGPDGGLLLWAGGISIHLFELPLAARVAREPERWLPWHASPKAIPTLDTAGRPVKPDAPNGVKLERFLFDGLRAADAVSVVETGRDEYSPVKNAQGGEAPATARRDLVGLYRTWLAEAGIPVPDPVAGIEIDHGRFDGADDFRASGISRLAQAGDAIRIASGANP